MKTLYLLSGPMGVGKTTVSRELLSRLSRCAFLDGDWCWTMQPFTVNDETKTMVMDNIIHVLSNFLRCSAYDNVVFCWVMHQQQISEAILLRLPLTNVRVVHVSLVCTPDALARRILRDVAAGIRQADVLERARAYLPLYADVQSIKLDTTAISASEVAEQIRNIGEMNQ